MKAKKPNNYLLVAITRMGDMLQASPTLAGIKMENPDARVTVLIERNFAAICDGLPGIDEVIVIDLTFITRCLHREQEALLDAYKYVCEQVDDLRKRNFDCVINMASSPYTAILIKLLGVENSLGWLSDDEGFRLISNPWAMLFAAYVYHSNRDYNTVNLVDILRCSSEINKHPERLVYNVPEADKKFAAEVMQYPELQGGGPLIGIQVGASQGKRQWAPKRFAELSRILVEKLGARLLFTGTRGEQPLVDAVFAEYSSPRMHNIVGKTSIAQLGGMLEHCDLLVTGDTGTMHLAVAVGKPVVALFLASALAYETGPYSHGNLIIQPQIHCNPCNPNYPCSRPDCHDQVSPELVAELVRLRLSIPVGSERNLTVPAAIADPNQVAVLISEFDRDGFVDLRQINGSSPRNSGTGKAAQIAYRRLWKEEFGAIPDALPQECDYTVVDSGVLSGFEQIFRLVEQGRELLNRLRGLVLDSTSDVKLLGETGSALERLDREIEDVGHAAPPLGALVRFFVMEKQNMRGTDTLILASEMEGLYAALKRRAEKMRSYMAQALGSRAALPAAETISEMRT